MILKPCGHRLGEQHNAKIRRYKREKKKNSEAEALREMIDNYYT